MDYESAGVSLQEQNLFHFKLYNKMNWLGGHVGSFDVGAYFLVSTPPILKSSKGEKHKILTSPILFCFNSSFKNF